MSDNFCPAPWISLFYQNNKASMCCVDTNQVRMSPIEFRNSKYLSDIKDQFLNGEKPKNCSFCWKSEEQGLQSIRQHYNKRYPNFVVGDNMPLRYIELRASDTCNMGCRMCNTKNSSKLNREVSDNPHLSTWFGKIEEDTEINDENWKEILATGETLDALFMTGGEPMLIKKYYELMDFLIDIGTSSKINLHIYTNASVYNPIFIDKMLKFKSVNLNLSIDGVEEMAEYQRYGVEWKTIQANIERFLLLPVRISFHTTITAYNLLDLSSLAKFYNDILKRYPGVNFKAHVAGGKIPMHYLNLPEKYRTKAIEEIIESVKVMINPKFSQINNQLVSIVKMFKEKIGNYEIFIKATEEMDLARGQSFKLLNGIENDTNCC